MDELLRISSKINIAFGIIVVILTSFALYAETAYGTEYIWMAALVCLLMAAAFMTSGIMSRICLVIAIVILVISVLGIAMGISTGTISYIYVAAVPAMGFHAVCVQRLRPSKPKNEGALGYVNQVPPREIEIYDTERD